MPGMELDNIMKEAVKGMQQVAERKEKERMGCPSALKKPLVIFPF